MYKNTFEKAFSDISPKTPDEEFARKIWNAADRQKLRTAPRKAVILPIAAAVVAVSAVTASAAGGLDLFGAFRSYFSRQTEQINTDTEAAVPYADLSTVGMTACEEIFDTGDYTVQVNGLIADSHYVYLYYDVIYRDQKYFENGKVGAKYTEQSPVNFFTVTGSFHTWGWGEPFGVNENTVSYVQSCAGEFEPDPQTGEYPFKFTCSCVDDPSFIFGECIPLGTFTMEISVPPAKEQIVEINGEIPLPDGQTTVLEEASFGPLSVTLRFDNDCFYPYTKSRTDFMLALKMKDGSILDLTRKSSMLSPAEGYEWRDDSDEPPAKEPEKELSPAVTTVTREEIPAVTTTVTKKEVPAASSMAERSVGPGKFGTPCVLELGYDTAIDPEAIAEIEIFGNVFSIK